MHILQARNVYKYNTYVMHTLLYIYNAYVHLCVCNADIYNVYVLHTHILRIHYIWILYVCNMVHIISIQDICNRNRSE